jgi:zona occludens toxin
MHSVTWGPPRSGKSYRYTSKIVEEYKKFKMGKSKYRFIYTNINAFNYDAFEGFVRRYNKLDLENEMKKEFTLNDQHANGLIDLTDYGGDYDKWAVDQGVFKEFHQCWIVIDEAYGTFTKQFEDHKGRFLAYHGHWKIDIDFILQGKRQVNREYLTHVEYLYVVTSSTKRLRSNVFSYKQYNTAEATKDNYITTEHIKFSEEVANFYSSGSNEKYKSVVGKKLLPVVLLGACALYLMFGMNNPTLDEEEPAPVPTIQDDNTTQQEYQEPITQDQEEDFTINTENRFYIRSNCREFGCKFDGYTLTLSEINTLMLFKQFNCQLIISEKVDQNYWQYYVGCDLPFSQFLYQFKEVKDDETVNKKSKRSDVNGY